MEIFNSAKEMTDTDTSKRKRDPDESSNGSAACTSSAHETNSTYADDSIMAQMKEAGLHLYPSTLPRAKAVADIFGLSGKGLPSR